MNDTRVPVQDTVRLGAAAVPLRVEDAYPGARQSWFATGILSFLYILSYVDRNIMVLLAEPVSRDMGLGDFELGLLYGPAFAVFFALAGLPLGWAIDRYSRRTVIWSGVFIWSIATTACGLARDFVQLLIARAGVGAGEAVLVPGSQSILADSFPPDRMALPLSVYGLGGKVGAGLSFVLGGMLIGLIAPDKVYHLTGFGDIKGWQLIFIVAGLPGALLAFAIFLIPEPPRRKLSSGRPGAGVSYRDYGSYMVRNIRFFANHHLAIIVLMIVMTAISTWTPSYLTRVHGMPAEEAGYWLGMILMAAAIAGTPVHGALADRLFRKGRADAHLLYFKWTICAGLIPAVAAYVAPSAWLAIALIAIAMTAMVGFVGLLPSALQSMVPSDMRGKAASIGLVAGALGGMTLGPIIVAILTESVYQRPDSVGLSIATCVGVCLPLTVLLLTLAQKPMRDAAVAHHHELAKND